MNISTEGISMQQSQIDAMCEYPQITSVKNITEFMGSIRFFADFIPDLGEISAPLSELTKKDQEFLWNVDLQSRLRILQFHMATAPKLSYFDPSLETFTHSDASKFAIGGWLGQIESDGITKRIVSYWSRKLTLTERNYPVHERELLALIGVVKKFRYYLHGVQFTSYVDHRSLEHLQRQPELSARQVRWVEFLQEFMPTVRYEKGSENTFADWLSRRPDFLKVQCPECHHQFGGQDPNTTAKSTISSIQTSQSGTLYCHACTSRLPEAHHMRFNRLYSVTSTVEPDEALLTKLIDEQQSDDFCKLLETYSTDPSLIPPKQRGYFKTFKKLRSGVWVKGSTAVILPEGPRRLAALESCHDGAEQGHWGFAKTIAKLRLHCFWPNLANDLIEFLKSCHLCQQSKASLSGRHGFLHPLDIPDARFESIAIDFAEMPKSSAGYDYMLLISCRFSRLLVAVPCHKTLDAEGFATLFWNHWVLKGYGIPSSIISDRDSLFLSVFWTKFCTLSKIDRRLSTARHQQTDGLSEIGIRYVKESLQRHINYHQNDWPDLLPAVIFAHNNSKNSTTGFSPYYLAYAFDPVVTPLSLIPQPKEAIQKTIQSYFNNVDIAKKNILTRQLQQANAYNQHRLPAPEYKVGEEVWLNREGIKWPPSSQQSAKLQPQWIGPFTVSAVDKELDNITLSLPSTMQCHPIFHVSKLKHHFRPNRHFVTRACPTEPPPVYVENDGAAFFEVESILDHRWKYHKLHFLVRWKNYGSERDWWLRREQFATSEMVDEYLASDIFSRREEILKGKSSRKESRSRVKGKCRE